MMLHEIADAVAHADHTVTVAWSDGVRANVSLAPFLEKGGVFEALKDPAYFVREMRVLPGGIGLAWPDEVDFSADGLRLAASDDDEANAYGRYKPQIEPTGEEELYYVIMRLVEQSCGQKDCTEFDSWAISAYELAIEELDSAGFVEIEPGGRIYAKLTVHGQKFMEWMEYHERRKRILEARRQLASGKYVTVRGLAHLHNITVAELTGGADQ